MDKYKFLGIGVPLFTITAYAAMMTYYIVKISKERKILSTKYAALLSVQKPEEKTVKVL